MAMSIRVPSARLASVETTAFLFKSVAPLTSAPLVSVVSRPEKRVVRLSISATAAKTPATGKREPRGIIKPKRVSPEMQAFLGVEEIPRTLALKEIWAYIKQHDLQDPENKTVIICDDKLKSIFANKDEWGFLTLLDSSARTSSDYAYFYLRNLFSFSCLYAVAAPLLFLNLVSLLPVFLAQFRQKCTTSPMFAIQMVQFQRLHMYILLAD